MTTPPASDVTALFADLATRFGMSRAAGACLGTIWRAAQAPSAEDLCNALGLSRSNVSVALKELRQAGLVQVARAPGTRRDFYVADPNPWALLRAALADRHRREIAPLTDRLATLAATDNTDPRVAALAEMSAVAEDWFARQLRRDAADFAQFMGADKAEKKKKKGQRGK
ncbi:ArsR family transcriptional regulator [Rhodobacter sp. JA431]|uniref:GbsR/MarR family transcriptional regulator n=1 Tax=Rhodobacter sp. JA431 TaxID=570013 RepID=UPI000BD9EEC7|nr:MarR family transcriptional regulator [Rhodobacter sp. JA431]SOC04602.1 ArsR family transcriptional regulator [Rhodobacter sp. JA431]